MRSRLSLVSALCGSLVLATAGLLAWAGSASSPASAQVATKLDFRRDIQPLLQEHCIECHGPDEQSGGFRFDSRRSVRKVAGRLQPGSSATSRMYLRLVNDDFGPRMPRDSEQLRPDQIAIVKNWIDQGAEWPDDLAGDDPAPPPPDPVAMQMITALRRADARAFVRLIRAQPQTINRRVIGGATPLMYAALYGDQRAVRLLLDHGADPNIANEAGATALMWAVDDPRITTLLLDRGANVNALTPEGHGALSIAAGRRGADRVVEILLDRGATPSPEAPGGRVLSVSRPTVPLAQAASAGNESVFRMLVERGADLKAAGGAALVSAARGGCGACVEMLIGAVTKADLTYALVGLARYGDTRLLARLIDRGAEVNGRVSRTRRDVRERTPVLLAASSDLVHAETIRMLLARGADINAVGPEGETALDLAKRNGDTDVVRVLVEAGARTGGAFPTVHATPQPASSARAAFARVVPLLQRSDVIFTQKTGCVSCHNNTLTAMTIAAARTRHLPFDDRIAASQREVIASILAGRRERAALGSEITQQAVSNILTGLAAERHTADVTTDVMAYFLKGRQSADGRWRNFLVDHRPPVQHSDIEATATAIRALRVYAPMPRRAAYEDAVHRATTWLLTAQPRTVDERAWQLLGFAWAGVDARDDRVRAAARSLLAEQRADGGWSQLPTLASDAYATGQALVALLQVGAVRSSDPPYRRGVECLLGSQLADGSWYVKSRALAFQPYFESGFPHGSDQWVSMAASNWAAMALASAAAPDASTPQARLSRAHSHERNIGKAAQALTPQPSHAGVIDHFVPHISTQRANEGSRVSLFVRERRSDPSGPAVLLVHGRSAAAIPSFDLEYRDYSWMAYLAAAGFDVFALDLQGYGSSSKPAVMDDPCNTSADNQTKYLIPNTLRAPCAPRYPHAFSSFATDWDEIDTVVEFIRSRRGDRALKIHLVGWSRGGMRVIGYAARRPDNVEKVVVLAPTLFPPAATVPAYPMNMTDRHDFFIDWDRQIDSKNCPQQIDPSISQVLWNSTIALDKLGSGWGSGVRRSPAFTAAGWTPDLPGRVQAPTLVIRGALDDQAPEQATRALYDALGGPKAYVTVSCGSHELVYETQHTKLLQASADWLRFGTYEGPVDMDQDGAPPARLPGRALRGR